jgi:hypothetical protein
MNSPPTTAALTLSLTGPYERQGTEAAEGVRLWAETARPTGVRQGSEWLNRPCRRRRGTRGWGHTGRRAR